MFFLCLCYLRIVYRLCVFLRNKELFLLWCWCYLVEWLVILLNSDDIVLHLYYSCFAPFEQIYHEIVILSVELIQLNFSGLGLSN
jgi:hypothetical protein